MSNHFHLYIRINITIWVLYSLLVQAESILDRTREELRGYMDIALRKS
jgi:hypothetical protein